LPIPIDEHCVYLSQINVMTIGYLDINITTFDNTVNFVNILNAFE